MALLIYGVVYGRRGGSTGSWIDVATRGVFMVGMRGWRRQLIDLSFAAVIGVWSKEGICDDSGCAQGARVLTAS